MQSPVSDFVFRSSDDAARHYWYLPATSRPPRSTTQWLTFRFRLRGMCAHSPASHFAIVLRARLGLDAETNPVSISGRGMTLGDTSLAQPNPANPHSLSPGFGGARGAQIESFWPGGNFLYRDCALFPEGLRDERWYRVQLHVSDERWIAFRLEAETGSKPEPLSELGPANSKVSPCVQDDAAHPVLTDATGALIALGRGAHESGPWSAEFCEIAIGWF